LKLQCKEQGSAIRYSELYGKQGSNNFFVKKIDANTFRCAMKEEDETLACGTGATAVAIAMNARVTDATSIDLNVEGGKLVVSFDKRNQYTNVYLKGR
jgi:diaminopimelate epimerase